MSKQIGLYEYLTQNAPSLPVPPTKHVANLALEDRVTAAQTTATDAMDDAFHIANDIVPAINETLEEYRECLVDDDTRLKHHAAQLRKLDQRIERLEQIVRIQGTKE